MNKVYLYLFFLSAFFASCATSKKVQVIQDALSKKDTVQVQVIAEKTKVDSSVIVKDIVSKIANTKLSFTTMNARVKVNYETVDKSDNYLANISIEKGRSIYITVRGAMGVIGLKALITKDSVFLFYPLNKKTEKRPLSYIQEIIKIPFTYATLEDLIVGNPIFMDDASVVTYKMYNNKLQVGLVGKLFKNLISLDEENTKVLHLKLDDIDLNQHRTCDITYYNHTAYMQDQFPMNRDIAIAAQSRLEIHMEVKDYTFNEPLKYTFSIPQSGRRR
jgi:hypothetical protein